VATQATLYEKRGNLLSKKSLVGQNANWHKDAAESDSGGESIHDLRQTVNSKERATASFYTKNSPTPTQ
jgi:hypothetical protein